MRCVVVVGPHAVGKTTAARAWASRYPEVIAVDCDHESVPSGVAPEVVMVLEGSAARANTWLPTVVRAFPDVAVISCHCSSDRMLANMRRRCESKGRKFNEGYWTADKLRYESRDRAKNLLRKLGVTVAGEFEINTWDDWDTVTDCFSRVYRRLHNGGGRRAVGS